MFDLKFIHLYVYVFIQTKTKVHILESEGILENELNIK